MLLMRRLNTLLFCMLMVFFLFLFAGCENISGLGKVKRMEIGNPSQELTQAYMITGVPETFLIDADGHPEA